MQNARTLALAVLLAVGSAVPQFNMAHAASLEATLQNVRIELIDLDLQDGIAPSIVFDQESVRVYAEAHDYVSPSDSRLAFTTFDAGLSLSVSAQALAATSTVYPGDIHASQSTAGASAASMAFGAAGGVTEARVQFDSYFLLSPATSMVVSAAGSVSGQIDAQDRRFLESSAYLSLLVPTQGDLSNISSLRRYCFEGSCNFRGDEFAQVDVPFEVGLSNSSDTSLTGRLSVGVYTRLFHDPVTSVPEPSSYALLTAGLVCLVFRQRMADRRSRSSALKARTGC